MNNPFEQLDTEEAPPCARYEASLELPRLQVKGLEFGRALVIQLWGLPEGAHGTLEYEVDGNSKELCQISMTAEQFCEITGHKFPEIPKQSPSEWATAAIKARLAGAWDDPALQKLGPVSAEPLYDIRRIMDICEAEALAAGRSGS